MKKIIYISFALALCVLCSCVREADVNPTPRKLTGKLNISVAELKSPAAPVTAKSLAKVSAAEGFSVTFGAPAPATRQGSLPDDQEIVNLLVVQVIWKYDDNSDSESMQIIGTPQYFTLDGNNLPLNYNSVDEEYSINFAYLDMNSELLCIANFGDPDLFEAGVTYDYEQLVKKLFITYESEADVTNGGIVMVGGTNIEPGNFSPYIYLERIVSKIELTVNYRDFYLNGRPLEINSIQLCSVPKMSSLIYITYQTDFQLYYDYNDYNYSNDVFPPVTEYYSEYGNPRFDQLYPHSDASGLFIDYGAVVDNISSGSTFVWYMPEHLRGSNRNIRFAKDKYRGNDPSYQETGVSYSTRIEIKGIYTDSDGENQNVKFTIYPGCDYDYYWSMTHDDFNIRRNYCYYITVNIGSLDNTDPRIETSENTGVQ